jgi:hypothetical protein
MKSKRMSVDERVGDAWGRMQKYEAIVENAERVGKSAPGWAYWELQLAQLEYAVAKDDRSDPFYKGD